MKQISYLLTLMLFTLMSCQPVENQEAASSHSQYGIWGMVGDS